MGKKVSLIISTYKQFRELKAILRSLDCQTIRAFEVIIAEDDESVEAQKIVSDFSSNLDIKLVQQPDLGFRKTKNLNNAIKISSGDYLIFNDGDCIPHTNFIESHLSLSENNRVISGRRVMLGPKFSEKMMNHEWDIKKLQGSYFSGVFSHLLDKTDYYEEGLFIDPTSYWRKLFKVRPMRDILGANFSFFKKDIEKINGFDEDYVTYGIEDNDLLWRFNGIGVELKSARNAAINYHLGKHEVGKGDSLVSANRILMEEKKQRQEFICKNGLKKLS